MATYPRIKKITIPYDGNVRSDLPSDIIQGLVGANSPMMASGDSIYMWFQNHWERMSVTRLHTMIVQFSDQGLFHRNGKPVLKGTPNQPKRIRVTDADVKSITNLILMSPDVAVHESIENGVMIKSPSDRLNQSKWVRYGDENVMISDTGTITREPITANHYHLLNFDFGFRVLDLANMSDDDRYRRIQFLEFLENMVRPRLEDVGMEEWERKTTHRVRSILYALGAVIARNPPDWWILLTGRSGVGKGSLVKFLKNLFGKLGSSHPMHKLNDDYTLADLSDKAINAVTETGSDRIEDEITQRIKQLASREDVVARHIYGSPFTYRATTWHIYSCNTPPTMSASDDAYTKRFVEIKCGEESVNFWESTERKDMEKWLTDNSDIVVAECLREYLDSVKEGWNPTHDAETKKVREEMANTSRSEIVFVSEIMNKEEGNQVLVDEVYAAYSQWMQDSGKGRSVTLSVKAFKNSLKGFAIPVIRSKKSTFRDKDVLVGYKLPSRFASTTSVEDHLSH